MSVYLLITGDFVKTGGMDRANYALASYLARRGNEVHLVAFRADDELLATPNVHFHPVFKPLRSYTLALPLLDRAGRRWARRIGELGGRVIVNGGSARCDDVNWVHYVHAAFEPQFDSVFRRIVGRRNHQTWLRDEREALLGSRIIIANSQRTKCELVKRLGLPAQRVHVVYYGTDAQRFRPAEESDRVVLRERLGLPRDRRIVLFIGAMSDRRKGFDTLFEAWRRRSADARWQAVLYVVGAGSEIAAWIRRVRCAGLAGQVHFLGHRNDVPDLLRAADLLVSPTRYEPYGLAVHEALCCGTPAIVAAGAGVAERYSADLGHLLLNDPNDVDELSNLLRRWNDDDLAATRALVRPLSDALRAWTWDDMAARMVHHMKGAGGGITNDSDALEGAAHQREHQTEHQTERQTERQTQRRAVRL